MANQVSTSSTSTSKSPVTSTSTQRPNQNSQGSKKQFTKNSSGKNGSSRNEKRARWAKRNRPVPKPVVKRGPAHEYPCVCHGEPATKPSAGMKEVVKDHDSGKMKDTTKGLGKWRCSVTRKVCKVTVRKPQPKEAQGNMNNLSCPDVVYPAPLHTPVLTEVKNAASLS